MGYVFDYNDARAYAQFMNRQGDSWATAQEGRLMLNLLNPQRGESILDIGCGTGASMLPLLGRGLNLTGIDPSPYMLDIFSAKIGHKVDLYRGCAEDLPFGDNEFNHAFFFLSLEFVEDPLKAVSEACRVAKDRVFFGFVNRMAFKSARRWRENFDQTGIFDHARIFSVWELKRVVREVAGPVPVSYRTVCHFPRCFEPRAAVLRSIGSASKVSIRRLCGHGDDFAAQIPDPAIDPALCAQKSRRPHRGWVGPGRVSRLRAKNRS